MSDVLPVLPLKGGVLFPGVEQVLRMGSPEAVAAVRATQSECLALYRLDSIGPPGASRLSAVGSVVTLSQRSESDGIITCTVSANDVARVVSVDEVDGVRWATIERTDWFEGLFQGEAGEFLLREGWDQVLAHGTMNPMHLPSRSQARALPPPQVIAIAATALLAGDLAAQLALLELGRAVLACRELLRRAGIDDDGAPPPWLG